MHHSFSLVALICLLILIAPINQIDATDVESVSPRQVVDKNETIEFVRDVLPIFQRSCVRCHGAEKQKGNFRLDVRESALTEGDSYAPSIIPGKSAESPLIKFVSSGGDLTMPPQGNPLSAAEVEILKRWIDQGANWPDEAAGQKTDKRDLWSIRPLLRPSVPDRFHSSNSIDAFIREKLASEKMTASLPADRATLIRRVYFDLIGLPPTPEQVDEFLSDKDEKAYERLIDQLLASPRYGERWARHWLDIAHFAETHGHDQDRIREHAWPYRDYVIDAFNSDKPYSRFIQEQIAADSLFHDQPLLTPALGFLAAGPWDESSLRDIREDTFDRQIARYLDRDDMLTNVINNVTSLTIQCARCHDHKFDPISQRDYYALQAVFAGVERANRQYDNDPNVNRQRVDLNQQKSRLATSSPELAQELLSPRIQKQVEQWESDHFHHSPHWKVIDVDSMSSSDGATLERMPDGSILSTGERPDKDTVTIVTKPLGSWFSVAADFQSRNDVTDQPLPGSQEISSECQTANQRPPRAVVRQIANKVSAIRLEVMADDRLPNKGPGRCDNGNFHLTEFELFTGDENPKEDLVNATSDFDQSGWEITKAIDHDEDSAWGIHPKEGVPHEAIFELKTPRLIDGLATASAELNGNSRSVSSETRLKIVLKQRHGRSHLIGRMRLSLTDSDGPVRIAKLPAAITGILEKTSVDRSEDQRIELAKFVLLEEIHRKLSALPNPELVYAAAADFEPDGAHHPPKQPRLIQLLHRGDIHFPRQEIAPGTLSCISSLPSEFEIPNGSPESARRRSLALWITHHDNSLTWRSIVNRIWHYHFGRGIVSTLNDFGHLGDTPSHPELLDWLAVEFRDGGQSFKSLHKLILTSETYRQTAAIDDVNRADSHRAIDADNRLLWKMNRHRLDAEAVRDAILSISGRLDLRMRGPSDRQFDLKPGIHVTPSVDYSKFDPDSESGRRRSIYRFLFRTLPDPFMESLDCPSGDQITPVRSGNVTIQQALALWNDVFIARNCEHIAEKIKADIKKGPAFSTDTEHSAQIELAIRRILCREPSPAELTEFQEYAKQYGLANFCRLLVNSNEFLYLN